MEDVILDPNCESHYSPQNLGVGGAKVMQRVWSSQMSVIIDNELTSCDASIVSLIDYKYCIICIVVALVHFLCKG